MSRSVTEGDVDWYEVVIGILFWSFAIACSYYAVWSGRR